MIELTRFSQIICTGLILTCFLTAVMVLPVAGADANIEAELGDTLNLHGVSYTGSSVYLFMTGPGLPANGVTLTDVSQRADQGKFTTIDLDSNQEWSYRWDTSRIMNEIKYGTYLVYVSNEPADKSQLGGTNTYKTLEVYFTESTTSRVSSSGSGTTYTLNPEMHSSVEVPKIAITSPTPTPTPLTTPPTTVPTATPLPTTKAPLLPAAVILAVLLGACAVIMKKQ